MRLLIGMLLVPLSTQARVCGGDERVDPSPANAAANLAIPLPLVSKHGGTIVTVEDVQLELVVKGDGEVLAYPVQANLATPPTLTADAQVTVHVPVQQGSPRQVRLQWNASEARFGGRVRGARVVAQPADVEVVVVTQGRSRRARAAHVIVVPPSVVVDVSAPRAVVVPPPPPVIRAEAPGARVQINGPSVDVRVQQPTLRVDVGGPDVRVRTDDRRRGKHKHKHRGRHRGHRR